MTKLICFFCLLFSSCFSNNCIKNKSYLQLKSAFRNEAEFVGKSGEIEFKEKLLSKICKYLPENNRILFAEEITHFGEIRKGLIYLYNTDEFLFFFKKAGSDIIVGKGFNDYLTIKKIIDILKVDFYKEANNLKKYFESKNLHDTPLLQFFLIDNNEKYQSDGFYEFFYSPNLINDIK